MQLVMVNSMGHHNGTDRVWFCRTTRRMTTPSSKTINTIDRMIDESTISDQVSIFVAIIQSFEMLNNKR